MRRSLEARVGLVGRRGTGGGCGLANELAQALARVGAVALLGAVALRGDDEHALAGEAVAGEPLEPRAHAVGQRRRMAHVEAQLHRAGDLVDVLPARPGGADEALRKLAFVDADAVGDADHGQPESRSSRPRIEPEHVPRAVFHALEPRAEWIPWHSS